MRNLRTVRTRRAVLVGLGGSIIVSVVASCGGESPAGGHTFSSLRESSRSFISEEELAKIRAQQEEEQRRRMAANRQNTSGR